MTIRSLSILVALIVLLALSFVLSLSVGAVSLSSDVIFNSLFDLEGPRQDFIVNKSRLPRTFIALLSGGALALSGAIVQAVLRNPLASPKIIGINSGAALAVLLAAVFWEDIGVFAVALSAGLGGIVASGFIYGLAEFRDISASRLILIGIAVGFSLDACVDFMLVTADTYEISAPLVWLTGSLWGRGWQELNAVWALLCILLIIAISLAHRLDIIRLGATQATGLGMNVRVERFMLLFTATMLASVSVAVVGVLGFIGLVAPHIARLLVGGVHREFLPATMLIGALLVAFADIAGRALFPPIEISAGIFSALFGAPFFVMLLINSEGRRGQ